MRLSLLFLAIASAVLAGCRGGSEEAESPRYESIDTVPMLIMQVKKCSRLYTSEYHIHKIVTHDDVVRLKGTVLQQAFNIKLPVGERKIAIPMDATLKAYIDFSDFSEANIEREEGGRITILLPDPKVVLTSSKVDQKNIRQYVGLVRAGFSDEEMAGYEQQGRAAIIGSIPQLGIIESAREGAARTLVPLLRQMGYAEEDVTIGFRKDYDATNIRTLLDNTTIEK